LIIDQRGESGFGSRAAGRLWEWWCHFLMALDENYSISDRWCPLFLIYYY
jgi:hypothetical protein